MDTKEIAELLSNEIFLIYGRPKIGKSELASQFPNPLFIATEPGLKYIRGLKDEQKLFANDWMVIKGIIEKIIKQIKDGTFKYNTVVIDTVDNATDYCQYYICDKLGIEHPSKMGHGRGWNAVTTELKRTLSSLGNQGICVVFISHSKQVEIETKTDKYYKTQLVLSGKNKNVVENMTDHILLIDSEVDRIKKTERRVIKSRGSVEYEAGSRNEFFIGENGGFMNLDFNEIIRACKQFKESLGG